MIKTDYSTTTDLYLVYPKGFGKSYHQLSDFYLKLYCLIPDNIRLFIIVNSRDTATEVKAQFPHKNIETIIINGFDEIWLRDILGINVGNNTICKPIYNPDYYTHIYTESYLELLKSQTEEILTKSIGANIVNMPLIMDGGNIITNGDVAFITDKVIKQNSGIFSTVEQVIANYLNIKPIIVKANPNDVLGHTDGYLSFINSKQLCVSSYPQLDFLKSDIIYMKEIKSLVKPLGLAEVPFYDRPRDEYVEADVSDVKPTKMATARGIYINYLRLNDTIILPEYTIPTHPKNISKDYNTINKNKLKRMGFKVKTINCDELGKLGGSLRCISFTN